MLHLPDDLAVIFVLSVDARNMRSGLADLLRRESASESRS